MTSAAAGECLPAADDRVDIAGIELKSVAAPAGALGGDHRRAAAEKAVEHDVAAGRAVEDRIGDHRHRFYCRMQRRQIALLAAAGKGVGPGVVPDIGAVAAELAELDVVAVSVAAVFEHKDKLMLAAVKRAHPGIVFGPNAEVYQFAIDVAAGGQQLFGMAPVHEDVVQRTVKAEFREIAASMA